MKRRKKSSGGLPAKGRLRDIADRLWSAAVRHDWADKCAICGARKCEAHHLVPRQHQAMRYDLRNGIALCAKCHQFDRDFSPHQNAAGFMEWLDLAWPVRAEWLRENCRPTFNGTTDARHYLAQIRQLRQYVSEEEFERIVGVRLIERLEEE